MGKTSKREEGDEEKEIRLIRSVAKMANTHALANRQLYQRPHLTRISFHKRIEVKRWYLSDRFSSPQSMSSSLMIVRWGKTHLPWRIVWDEKKIFSLRRELTNTMNSWSGRSIFCTGIEWIVRLQINQRISSRLYLTGSKTLSYVVQWSKKIRKGDRDNTRRWKTNDTWIVSFNIDLLCQLLIMMMMIRSSSTIVFLANDSDLSTGIRREIFAWHLRISLLLLFASLLLYFTLSNLSLALFPYVSKEKTYFQINWLSMTSNYLCRLLQDGGEDEDGIKDEVKQQKQQLVKKNKTYLITIDQEEKLP